MKRLFLGNLQFDVEEHDIVAFFGQRPVREVKIITDRETGKSRGFAFVELETHEAAEEAIAELNGLDMTSPSGRTRTVRVSEAHEKPRGGDSRGRDRDNGHGQSRSAK